MRREHVVVGGDDAEVAGALAHQRRLVGVGHRRIGVRLVAAGEMRPRSPSSRARGMRSRYGRRSGAERSTIRSVTRATVALSGMATSPSVGVVDGHRGGAVSTARIGASSTGPSASAVASAAALSAPVIRMWIPRRRAKPGPSGSAALPAVPADGCPSAAGHRGRARRKAPGPGEQRGRVHVRTHAEHQHVDRQRRRRPARGVERRVDAARAACDARCAAAARVPRAASRGSAARSSAGSAPSTMPLVGRQHVHVASRRGPPRTARSGTAPAWCRPGTASVARSLVAWAARRR